MRKKSNRRHHTRIPKVFIVHISYMGIRESIPTLMVDIGLGGMKTLSKMFIPQGEEVSLVIKEGEDRIEIPAEVAWSHDMDIKSELKFGIKYMSGFTFKLSREEIMKKIFDRFGILDFIGWTNDILNGADD